MYNMSSYLYSTIVFFILLVIVNIKVLLTCELIRNSQFKYVNYNPKGLKYPSQLGAILKREYPGMIKVYDDHGTVVKHQPALSWNDYYWKKNKNGVYYAKRVKQEFWVSILSSSNFWFTYLICLSNLALSSVCRVCLQLI